MAIKQKYFLGSRGEGAGLGPEEVGHEGVVSGGNEAIGKQVVPLLVSAGHAVTGTTRNPDKAAALRSA
jgi:hypothetical protein